ncbi:MAG: hypothetical protein BWX87_01370 [Bacteroidetes bacterium ADurb.Bin123]|jgi:hypothetical protein|nr:MAG: hypothetical protein BWX87_01370 [Bacteroidetes bacterium ADurb.Bin123]
MTYLKLPAAGDYSYLARKTRGKADGKCVRRNPISSTRQRGSLILTPTYIMSSTNTQVLSESTAWWRYPNRGG